MKNVLIVDDEKSFIMSLTDGLSVHSADFNVLTAGNGRDAVKILESVRIDTVVTDLKMPVMDGYELLAYINNNHPTIPVIVMTAFGTPEIEDKVEWLGAVQYLEKPLDFNDLAARIFDSLAAGSKGYINGITLPSFLQLVEMEKKSCTLTIKSEERTGILYFAKGELVDAKYGKMTGDEAAYNIVCWDNAEIEIANTSKKRKKNIKSSLNHILMEGFRLKDEYSGTEKERRQGDESVTGKGGKKSTSDFAVDPEQIKKEANIMAVQDKLKEFAAIDGFGGVGIFTPTGESLAMLNSQNDNVDLKSIGILANNVLMNAQKASLDMGTGRGQLVHIEAEKAHIFVRCMNEGTDPLKSQPGKAHIHLVLVLTNDSSIGLAKMKINAVISAAAPEFRM